MMNRGNIAEVYKGAIKIDIREGDASGTSRPTITVLGVPVARLDVASALAEIEALGDRGKPSHVAYVNAHTLNLACRDPSYRAVLCRADLVLNDGVGLALAAHLQGQRFPANLNGSDFTPLVLSLAARRGWPVYFLGARPNVAVAAANRLQESIPNLQIAGTHDGYFTSDEVDALLREVRNSEVGLLLVALGNPLQEFWLDQHLVETGVRLGMGVGAFFDFAAGVVPRAPHWMNRAGIEWVYRLRLEPRRMWRRYVVGNPVFLVRVGWQFLTSRNQAIGD